VPIVVCVLLGILLGVWHNRAAARERPDVVTSTVRTITAPVVRATGGVGAWFSRQFGWLLHGKSMDTENRRLKEEVARLREENARLREAEITAARLKQQLGFENASPGRKVAAEVISLRPDPRFNTIVMSRGSRDGVHVKSVVVSPTGLVGQVTDVAPTSASVLLLSHQAAAVGAMVQRPESRAAGICKGDGGNLLNLSYLTSDADVKPGDVIVSSGKGGTKGVFPKGVPIGTVTKVVPDASGATKFVTVKPAVNFDRLEEVYVLQ
jgi:rod shape-determining protein MreC